MALAVAALTASAGAQGGMKEEFTAVSVNMNVGRMNVVDMVVERWSPDGDREALLQTFADKGQEEMLKELMKRARLGSLRLPNTLGHDLHYAVQQPLPDGGRRIILVTDRSIGMGEARNQSRSMDYPFTMIEIRFDKADPTIKRWHDMMAADPVQAKAAVMELIAAQANKKLPGLITDPRFTRSVWAKNTAIAEKYNEPGRFTAFIGYEWTSNAGGGDNLHRNVIYRDNKDKADQVLPYTTFQSENPEDLWKWDDGVGSEDERQAPGHPAQRQPLQRQDVRTVHLCR